MKLTSQKSRTAGLYLAMIVAANMTAGCVIHTRGGGPPPVVGGAVQLDIVDDHGYHHQGYYDDHHDWHGGYYDEGHNWHDDDHDWHH
jgi:hypothetical protein